MGVGKEQRVGRVIASLALALTSGLAACGGLTNNGGGGGRQAAQFKPGFNLLSPQQDIEIGRRSAVQVERQMRLLPDADVQRYISALGQRLAAKAPGEKFPYQFHVVDVREINAFALPGGFTFVNRGTIEAARNEAELAGVMAHEISHVALRHGTSQMSKAYVAQRGLSIIGSILGGGRDAAGDMLGALGGAGLNLVFLRFGRTAEKQADLTGIQIMTAAGYDPRAMISFFETLGQKGSSRPPEFLSDHPDPGNRVRYLTEALPSLPVAKNPTTDTPEFDQARARLRGLPPPAQQRAVRQQPPDGGVERPSPPSAEEKTFRAPDGLFEISYPADWESLAEGGEHLAFAPQGAFGRLKDGGVVVTHGTFVGTYELPANARDLERATEAYIELQLRGNPELQPLNRPQPTSLGGRPALATPVGGDSPVTGRAEYDVIYTTLLPNGRLFYLVTIVPQDEREAYKPAFERTLASLRFGG